jgi:hypothetical protein
LTKRIRGKALPTGDWRLDWLGRYGVHSSAPRHVDDLQPWIVQTKALDVQPVSNILLDGPPKSDLPIGGIFYPLLNRTGKGVAPRQGNLLIQSLKSPQDLYHEGGHYLATMLDKHYTFQPLKNMKKAAEAVAERLPMLKARIDAGRFSPYMVFRRVTDRIPKLHSEAPNITRYLKGRGYDDFTNAELGHEILGHWIGNHFPLSEAARSPHIMREVKYLDNDPLFRAIKETTYSDLFMPPQVKDLRKLGRAPTNIAAQTQRTIRHLMRQYQEEEMKKKQRR